MIAEGDDGLADTHVGELTAERGRLQGVEAAGAAPDDLRGIAARRQHG